MTHYVLYHNTEKRGLDFGTEVPFEGFTRRPKGAAVGDAVWTVVGKGKSPRRFFLRAMFIVARIEPSDQRDLPWRVIGTTGSQLDVEVGTEAWFREFMSAQQNFRFGFNPIGSQHVTEFQRIRSASLPR